MRLTEGRHTAASAGILDSQSVKTATMINKEVGYDAGKQIKGRKRFTLVDTFGLLIAVKVVAASIQSWRRSETIIQKNERKT